jgi:hypothetical protein
VEEALKNPRGHLRHKKSNSRPLTYEIYQLDRACELNTSISMHVFMFIVYVINI